ncbi:MAG: family 43 glycosylhydrolase [Polyangia bacterium]
MAKGPSLRGFGFLVVAVAGVAVTSRVYAATSGNNGTHDPSRMIASNGKFYVYPTGGGTMVSSDGLAWSGGTAPAWNRSLLSGNEGIWAPDIIYLNGKYMLFYSMYSSAKASAIGLLTSPTLDPSAAGYKWTDQGAVVTGPAGVSFSMIDPCPVLDGDGNLWVSWGGGYPFPTTADSIWLTRLDNDTGKPLTSDTAYMPPNHPGHPLEQGHKEGSYVYYHGGHYYLWWQTGSCCSGASSSYTMHVAQATSITGPYTGDRTFYSSTGSMHGPGHIGIYDKCGASRFTYHYYTDAGNSILGENELTWGSDGWPVAGAESTTPLTACNDQGNGGASGSSSGSGGTSPGSGGAGGRSGAAGAPGRGPGGSTSTGTGGNDTGGTVGTGGFSATGGTTGTGGTPASGGTTGAGGTTGTGQGGAGDSPAGVQQTEGGCSCDVPGAAGTGAGSALVLLGLALAAGRRRGGANGSGA